MGSWHIHTARERDRMRYMKWERGELYTLQVIVQGMGNTCCPAILHPSVSGLIPCTVLSHCTVCTILYNILEPIVPIPVPVQCEWAIIRLNTVHTVAGGARTLDEENWIRAFPFTSVAAICKITDSKL